MSSDMKKVISQPIGLGSHTGTFVHKVGFKKKEVRAVLFLSPPLPLSRSPLYVCQVWKEWKPPKSLYLEEHPALWVLKTWKRLLANMLFWDRSRCCSIGKKLLLSLLDFTTHAGNGHMQRRSSHGLCFVVFETLTDVQGRIQHILSTCFAGSSASAILESLIDSGTKVWGAWDQD